VQQTQKRAALVELARYTGQESKETREAIAKSPPDILLTNFMMFELLLTLQEPFEVIANCEGLKFLILDELHTYRGRQGADFAMLVRRLRECLTPGGALQASTPRPRWPARDRQKVAIAERVCIHLAAAIQTGVAPISDDGLRQSPSRSGSRRSWASRVKSETEPKLVRATPCTLKIASERFAADAGVDEASRAIGKSGEATGVNTVMFKMPVV
jgi:hypothetical protein